MANHFSISTILNDQIGVMTKPNKTKTPTTTEVESSSKASANTVVEGAAKPKRFQGLKNSAFSLATALLVLFAGITFTTLNYNIGRLDTRIDRLEDRIDQRFEAVDQRFEAVDQRFEAQDEKLDEINLKLTALISALNASAAVDAAIDGTLLTP